MSINLGEGSGDKMGGPQNRDKLWTVKWKSATMDFYQAGEDFSGTLNEVTGSIYDKGKISSTFESARSIADKRKQVLALEGKVTVISQKPPMTLTCDRMTYNAESKIIKALGHVVVDGPSGRITGLEEVWTTPELTVVASPDMFPVRGKA